MRISRLYLDTPLQSGQLVTLDADRLNYVARVLRLKPGHELVVFNGEGGEYAAQLTALHKRAGSLTIGEFSAIDVETPLSVTLVQGISRGERMDYTLQKATELGVRRIVPVFTTRSVVNLSDERLENRRQHWQGVIRSACEQSGRNRLPLLDTACELSRWLKQDDSELRLLLQPGADRSLRELPAAASVSLLIGPEGGLEEHERELAVEAGYVSCRLGPRVLRTETAAVAAIAALQLLQGDLGN